MLSPETNGRAARPLRILMVLESNFTMKGGGGAESQLRTLSRYLKRLGHKVTIVTPLLPWGPPTTADRCYGVAVARIAYPRRPIVGGMIMGARFAALLLGRGRSYDAWHVHIGHHLGAVACLLGAVLNKPVVVKISGWWELEQGVMRANASVLDRLALYWLKRARTVQAISQRIATELTRHGFSSDRVVVLPNAVDTNRFQVRAQPRPPGAPFTAVFVGRLVPEKGLPTLLDAWAEAFAGRGDVRLRLVGGGPLEPALREQAQKLGITAQVDFVGHAEHVEEILAGADVGVLCSRIEGLSNTLLEFMASGLPSVATRVSGSEDFVVPGRNGWLVPVGEVSALRDALADAASLSKDRLHALGRQARADVEARASLNEVVGRLLSFYTGGQPAVTAAEAG
jgi:glycosyltransferase involved in cell wall biosynthesis